MWQVLKENWEFSAGSFSGREGIFIKTPSEWWALLSLNWPLLSKWTFNSVQNWASVKNLLFTRKIKSKGWMFPVSLRQPKSFFREELIIDDGLMGERTAGPFRWRWRFTFSDFSSDVLKDAIDVSLIFRLWVALLSWV